jgi:hypothetical protein
MLNLRMEAFEAFAQFADTHRRPRFDRESRFGLTGHEVDLASIRLDIIDDDVTIGTPPFGAVIDLMSAKEFCREHGPISDPAREIRLVVPKYVDELEDWERQRMAARRAQCAFNSACAMHDPASVTQGAIAKLFTPRLDDSTAKFHPADRDIAPACHDRFP